MNDKYKETDDALREYFQNADIEWALANRHARRHAVECLGKLLALGASKPKPLPYLPASQNDRLMWG